MIEKTVKCPICGDPYKFYPWFAGDQSACPECITRANLKEKYERMVEFTKKNLT